MKQYGFNGLAGCVAQIKARQTGTLVGIYHGPQAGMEDERRAWWQTVCEVHNSVVGHPTLALARSNASDPQGWCEECREPTAQGLGAGTLVAISCCKCTFRVLDQKDPARPSDWSENWVVFLQETACKVRYKCNMNKGQLLWLFDDDPIAGRPDKHSFRVLKHAPSTL